MQMNQGMEEERVKREEAGVKSEEAGMKSEKARARLSVVAKVQMAIGVSL